MAAPVETEVVFSEQIQTSRLQVEAREEKPVASKPPEADEEENLQPKKKDRGCFGARRRIGPKTRKPPSNKWLQQQIPACRPVFTAKHVFALFVVVGVVFICLGSVFVATTVQLRDMEVEYTDCGPLPTDGDDIFGQYSSCEDYLENLANLSNVERRQMSDNGTISDCHCLVTFTVEKTLRYPWRFYYGLDNYYQNHRRYLNSWDPSQLRGEDLRSPNDNCRPITRYTLDGDSSRQPVAPCGLIANSWFNDSFHFLKNEDQNSTFGLSRNNIAWDSDRDVRFRNPSNLASRIANTNMPPYWLYNLTEIDDSLENESLIVWFRVSAFPWFRKLYARPENSDDLPAGNYSLLVTYNYPVDNFQGRKYIMFSELSWLGGRNLFLGITYIITGAVCLVTGIGLLLVHLFLSKWKTTHHKFLNRKY